MSHVLEPLSRFVASIRFARARGPRPPRGKVARLTGLGLGIAAGCGLYAAHKLEHSDEPEKWRDVPWYYRWMLTAITRLPSDAEDARITLIRRTWDSASRDTSLSPSQLATVGTTLGVRCGNGGYESESRAIACAILSRTLAIPSDERSTRDRLRAATCSLNVSIAERDGECWWPFLDWAASELADTVPVRGSQRDRDGDEETRFCAAQAYTAMIGWAMNAEVLEVFLPLYAQVYENHFDDPYQAADILHEYVRGSIRRGDLDSAGRALSRAFYLCRTGRAIEPDHEPASGLRIRIANFLFYGAWCEAYNDLLYAESAFRLARLLIELNEDHPGRVTQTYIDACEAGLLRVRLMRDTVSLQGLSSELDEDEMNP